MTRMLVALGAAVAATLGGAAAIAESTQRPVVVVAEPETATRHVSYADLDLATRDGERTLERRVRKAVNQVCAVEMGPAALFYVEYSCRKLTWRDTRPQVAKAISRAQQMAEGSASNVAATVIVVSAAR